MSNSILVTGATGTFGRAFLRSCFASQQWDRVVAYSRDEVKQAQLGQEFAHEPGLRLFLGDVRDPQRLQIAMSGIDTVVHAAALKRVDAGAYSPSEMIQTNIMGTMNVVNAAIHAQVARVVVISSDKAVSATNIYGATKYCGETYAVQANAYGHRGNTKIAAVRYGNVLGSRGSVVHVWREQMAQGKPITLTDANMTRFIMTIEEAVALVWFARRVMCGGEVFVPVLPSASMLDLARAVGGNHPLERTGLRPGGEKMAEALLNEEEPSRTFEIEDPMQPGKRYRVVIPSHHEWTAGSEWVQLGQTWLPDNFIYRSDRNDWVLGIFQLRDWMASTEACR
jgi:UDP-N-acetylglucosamine 4,6-dehydratase